MPAVTVPPSPNGLPIAITGSPTLTLLEIRELDRVQGGRIRLDLDQGEIGVLVLADHLALEFGAILQGHGDLGGVGDDVVVGDDPAGVIEHEAGTERHLRPAVGRGRHAKRHPGRLLAEEALHEAAHHLAVRAFPEAELAPLRLLGDRPVALVGRHGDRDHARHHLLDQVGVARPGGARGRRVGGDRDRRLARVQADHQPDHGRRGQRERCDPERSVAAPGRPRRGWIQSHLRSSPHHRVLAPASRRPKLDCCRWQGSNRAR